MRTYRVFNARGQHIGNVQAANERQAMIAAKERTSAPMVEPVWTMQEQQQLLYAEQERIFSYRNSWADHPHYSETYQ